MEVPGVAALGKGRETVLLSLSCASAGNCSAGGDYTDASHQIQAFVVSQVRGTWRRVIEVPGTAALNAGGDAITKSVSCGSAGSCSAGGFYTDGPGAGEAFIVREVRGTWRTAGEVPGTATLNVGGSAGIVSVSCASAGTCSAGGPYVDIAGSRQVFVVSES
jgi:hypothetical protein